MEELRSTLHEGMIRVFEQKVNKLCTEVLNHLSVFKGGFIIRTILPLLPPPPTPGSKSFIPFRCRRRTPMLAACSQLFPFHSDECCMSACVGRRGVRCRTMSFPHQVARFDVLRGQLLPATVSRHPGLHETSNRYLLWIPGQVSSCKTAKHANRHTLVICCHTPRTKCPQSSTRDLANALGIQNTIPRLWAGGRSDRDARSLFDR